LATITTITKTVLKRDWLAVEPKLLAVLAGLATGTALTELAKLFHYNLDPTLAVAIAGLLSLIVGYLKSSTLSKFPVAAAVTDVAAVVAAAVPTIAPQVAEVQTILAPAFVIPEPVAGA
jgi:hypothetical protein